MSTRSTSRKYGKRNYTNTRITNVANKVRNYLVSTAKSNSGRLVSADDAQKALSASGVGRNEMEFRLSIINRVFAQPEFKQTGYLIPSTRQAAKNRLINEWRVNTR